MAEDGISLSQGGLEDEDNEPARAPAVGGQSSTARLSTEAIEEIEAIEAQVYAISGQLGVLERRYRVVGWARLYGLRERQQPQGRERRPYVVGPSSRPVTSLRDMQQWMAEAGGEQQPGE